MGRPQVRDNFGFVAALQEYADKLSQRGLFRVTVQADDSILPLPSAATLTLFRVTQEALDSLDKHAHAQHVEIAVVQEHNGVSLRIKDDGQGTYLDQRSHGQYSLLYMRRAGQSVWRHLAGLRRAWARQEVRVSVPIA